jgi:hypothetical protein
MSTTDYKNEITIGAVDLLGMPIPNKKKKVKKGVKHASGRQSELAS